MLSRYLLPFLGLSLTLPGTARAAVPASPPPPAVYAVQIRFHIYGYGDVRLRQYTEMMQYLKQAGFRRAAEEEVPENEPDDPTVERLTGTIASDRVGQLLVERHVLSLLLIPQGAKLPADKAQRVRVDLLTASELTPSRQNLLRQELRQVLAGLGFREAVGYDDRDRTRLLGSVPAGQVEVLGNDPRRSPAGWRLLPKNLLSGLRDQQGGVDLLVAVLREWFARPEGRKLILPLIGEWRKYQSAQTYINSQPGFEESNVADVSAERLLPGLAEVPEAAPLLDKLQAQMFGQASSIRLVDLLLDRLRGRRVQAPLPYLFRLSAPLRATFARPDLPLPSPRPAAPKVPAGQEKVTADLRGVLAAGARAGQPVRMEVVLAHTPTAEDRTWQRLLLQAAPGLVIEGRLGSIVTVVGPPKQVVVPLAKLPEVAGVRLPRPPQSVGRGAWSVGREEKENSPERGLRPSSHAPRPTPHAARSSRVMVIDGDFRGWDGLIGKQLPADTRLIDLTRERNRDLQPDPFPKGEQPLGSGSRYALAVARTAPQAQLTLLRVDPECPYMLEEAARAVNGDPILSLGLEQRLAELNADRTDLERRKERLLEERRLILMEAGEEGEAVQKRRQAYEKRQAEYDRDERAYNGRLDRYLQHFRDLRGLQGVKVVTCPLVWNEGYPVNGSSTLSRYLDDRPFAGAWFQAAGDTRGQAWTGLFLDEDRNGVMEFAPPPAPVAPRNWTHELNFLAWQPASGKAVQDLPANSRFRVAIQWREPHDPRFRRVGEDLYRAPLANLSLMVLYQTDPSGKREPADDLEVVAQSAGLPQRLQETPDAAIYEQTVEFQVKKPGRYALQVRGRLPEGIAPPQVAVPPEGQRFGELRPRLFVQTLAGPGRAVLHDYATPEGSMGMPADARRAITVGAADRAGRPEPYSAEGPPANVRLLRKPDVLAFDHGEGTAEAANYAAGQAVSAVTGGAHRPASGGR